MSYIWVIVADSALLRIFGAESSGASLTEIESMSNPEGRMHDRDITSDLPGRSFDSNKTGGRHAMEPSTDPKHELAIEFARKIARRLDSARLNRDYEALVLVAPPSFLGILREQLNSNCKKLVVFEINKNLIKQSPEDIRTQLPKLLPAAS